MADSAASTTGDLSLEEAGKDSPTAGTGECLDVIDWFFRRALLMSLYFLDKSAAGNIGLTPLDVPR